MKIAFHCGTSLEEWSPGSVARGVGGSQEAVIELARRLRACGHEVHVYNSCGEQHGEYDGVLYHDIAREPGGGPTDIRVVWRNPWLLDKLDKSTAGRTYLWLHEAVPQQPVVARGARFDRLIVLSRFHRSCYPELPDERIFRTRNGIDPSHFRGEAPRRSPRKVVYASSYARGLETLLDLWPAVLREVLDASLTVFYGWQSMRAYSRRPVLGWRRFLRWNPVTFHLFRSRIERKMVHLGVEHAGRISHAEVARQFRSAGVWAYPTAAPESSCITAMKAQAGGAIPVVTASGALSETVRFGRVTSPLSAPGARQEWLDALLDVLRHPERQESERQRMMAAACESFSWDGVAEEWSRELVG